MNTIRLMDQSGLFDGKVHYRRYETIKMRIVGLSNEGHNLLDFIRDETVWEKTQEGLDEVGGSVGIDLPKAVATAVATKLLGIG